MRAERLRRADAALVAAALFLSTDANAQTARDGGGATLDVGGFELAVHAPYRPLLQVPGVAAPAHRFDGNSTRAQTDAPVALDLADGVTVSAWVALASPPVETAAIVHLDGPEGALKLAVGPWRAPEFRVGDLRAATFEGLELGRWVHLAGTFDGATARLYVDGELAAENAGDAPSMLSGRMAVGRSLGGGMRYDAHQLGVWNGVIGNLTLELGQAAPPEPEAAPADAPVAVPPQWFTHEPNRPVIHPMPPAGWTNEPHTLTHDNGAWHLYHQANPNGAFWDHIVWGHLVSQDLVSWEARPPALVPGTGFDRRGIWVGNHIPDTEPASVL